jgi:DNA polymerase
MAKITVDSYRRVNHEIVAFWRDLENAFKKAIQGSSSVLCGGKVHVTPMEHPWKGVQIRLPSGNYLYYHYAHLKEEPVMYQEGEFAGQPIMRNGKAVTREVMVYMDNEQGRFEAKKVYGGLLTEHGTSSTARDIMVPAMWRLEQAGFDVTGTVHDELWAQAEPGRSEEFERVMCINPSWCKDMHISAGLECGVRYLK